MSDSQALRALALVGYGHFTTVRVTDGAVRGLNEHLERLAHDCREVFDVELDLADVRRQLAEATATEADVLARITIVDPELSLVRPGADAHPRALITTRPVGAAGAPQRLHTSTYTRPLPAVKHTALFPTIRERRLAQRAGFDDAVFLDEQGRFSEGPTFSIGFLEGDRLVWPIAEALPSVTVALVSSAWPHETAVEPVTPADLPRFDAAFTAGSGAGIRPVASIDAHALDAAHPALAALQRTYASVPATPL
ncbi:MAG: aminotransferase class IV [Microbacterium sp.]